MARVTERRSGRGRLFLLMAFLLLAFLVILIRLLALQGLEHADWRERADREHERSLQTEGERGRIYDRNGRPLAVNVEVPSIFAVPALMHQPQQTARRLARLLGEDPGTFGRRFDPDRKFVWVRRKVEPSLAEKIASEDGVGIGIVMERQRVYPKHLLLGQALGFSNVDNRGLEGVELAYDPILRGEEGRLIFHRDARGRLVFPKDLSYQTPAHGQDLYLSVDEVIQYIGERELDRALTQYQARAGTVIVMDPYTGEVLALAVRPQFNPNARDRHQPDRWRNRAITDQYEPGSTFKIIAAAAALEEGVVDDHEWIFCDRGRMPLAGGPLRDPIPRGWLTFSEVMAHSSNIGVAKVADRVGPKRFREYIEAFGFGSPTGIDLPGEVSGMIRPVKDWSKRSLAMVSIGQEIAVTPMQMVAAAAAVANGGTWRSPRITLTAQPEGSRPVTPPAGRRRVISPRSAERLTEILKEVVAPGGTGELAAVPGFAVAGKTGTAQKFDPETGRYSPDRFVSSFVGFVPADHPRLVILVLIDEPQGTAWGGSVAAPVFRTIAEQSLHHLEVAPQQKRPVVVARAGQNGP